jgi:glyoxylase-like metal-dependent hydrolase (beta-lactamase superfamily II)
MIRLTDHLYVAPGLAHTGILTDGTGRALLIDPGADTLPRALQDLGVTEVAAVLLTHHHPAQHAALSTVRAPSTKVLVPRAEHALLADPAAAFWSDPKNRWHVYHTRPHAPMPARSIAPTGTLAPGDITTFGPARITAIATPGHTDGSLSFLVEVDGRRVAFVGDALAGPGQIPDIFSLQQGVDGLMDYHGYLGGHGRLLAGLRDVLAHAPDTLVSALGGPMAPSAIPDLEKRLSAAYAAYLSGSAGRYYFPKLFAGRESLPYMPDAPTEPAPAHVRHTGTTYVVISETGGALVLDCGDKRVIEHLRQWQRDGEIGGVEALWISHYHDDHVDAVPDFLAAFPGCPVLADGRLADVLERPEAFRLPCQSPHAIPVTRRLADGKAWRWHEFTLTSRFFPGQTLYHGALLAEGRGHRLFFIGDAFTPTGMDDYCAYNRNLLREAAEVKAASGAVAAAAQPSAAGYARCLQIVRAHNPVLMFNCHVDPGFRFEEAQLNFLEGNLAERRRLFAALLPWPDPDFGLDSEWARAHPYQQSARAGTTVRVEVRIDNHAREAMAFAAALTAPDGWQVTPETRTTTIAGRDEGTLTFEVAIPTGTAPGRHVVPVHLHLGDRDLGPITEALIDTN